MTIPNPMTPEELDVEHRALDPLVELRDHTNLWDISALWHSMLHLPTTVSAVPAPAPTEAE